MENVNQNKVNATITLQIDASKSLSYFSGEEIAAQILQTRKVAQVWTDFNDGRSNMLVQLKPEDNVYFEKINNEIVWALDIAVATARTKFEMDAEKAVPTKQKKSKQPKVYTVIKTYKNRETKTEGTLADLIQYFSYTLEIGHSWNSKISRNPKTIASFMSNLKKSFDVKEASCYQRTYVELIGE